MSILVKKGEGNEATFARRCYHVLRMAHTAHLATSMQAVSKESSPMPQIETLGFVCPPQSPSALHRLLSCYSRRLAKSSL